MTHRTDRESLFLSLILRDFLFPHRAANDFEFEEPAFEGAVEEGRATAGCQTDQLGQTQIRREEVRTPACEGPLDTGTEPRGERTQLLLITEADPIGRGRHHQQRSACREILTHRSLGDGGAKPTLEECLTRGIEVERHVLTVQKRVNTDIRSARGHVGTNAGGYAEAIADRVFDPEGDKIQAVQRALLGTDLHLDRAADGKPRLPGQRMRGLKNIVLVAVGAVKDAPQHPAGDPAVEVDCVAEGKRAGEGYPAREVSHVLRAQLLQLGTQHRLQPTRARGEEGLVLLTHMGRTSGRFRAETYGLASERRKGNESSPRKARLIPGYSRDTCNFRTWS